jgi:tetratricopeptide (TPR) repeat protein
VVEFVSKNFVPARFHIKEQPDAFGRFGAQWTPTILIDDANGKEQHRIEGFLPVDDFLAQLQLGLGHAAFKAGRFDEAEKWFEQTIQKYPKTDAGPEAQYWAGVSRYKGSNDGSHLKATADAFKKRYSDTTWAKKASVWA